MGDRDAVPALLLLFAIADLTTSGGAWPATDLGRGGGGGSSEGGGSASRDYCLHESFNATCRPGYVILMTSAFYGRMRLGRCINGDYNVGCSLEVITYFDSQCSGRESCDISVRNLVDIHPCERDFMSYLEASYRCIEVSTVHTTICPRDGHLTVSASSSSSTGGHIVHGLLQTGTAPPIGTKTCPWTIAASPGQRILTNVIVVGGDDTLPSVREDAVVCSTVFVIADVTAVTSDDDVTEVAACAGRSRERHLYTSSANRMTIYVSRGFGGKAGGGGGGGGGHVEGNDAFPRFILSYEAIGCPDLTLPSNAWSKRMGDNVMIKCNDTMETFYLTCQANRWIGEVGNCSHDGAPLVRGNDRRTFAQFPAHGIALAVLLGVALGIFIGIFLLLTVHCARRRSASLKGASMVMALNKDKDPTPAEDGGAGGLRRSFGRPHDDPNYPALIMNMEKVYDFDNPRLCPACDRLHRRLGTTPSPPSAQCHKIRQDCYPSCAAQRGTILRHCRCGGGGDGPGSSSLESNLEREPLYDGEEGDDGEGDNLGRPGNGFGFDNFDLVTTRRSQTTMMVTPDSSTDTTGTSSYPPGLRTPELLASPGPRC